MMPVGWPLWLGWVLATTLGWSVGGYVSMAVGSSSDIIVVGYAGVVVGGILAGVLQWLMLRRQVTRAGWWVLTSIVAVAVVGFVVFIVGVVNADVGWVVGVGACGILLGVLQWLVLRRQFTRAGWWVLASTVGWIVGGLLGGIGGWALLGAVYGAITGFVLVRLLRQPAPDLAPLGE